MDSSRRAVESYWRSRMIDTATYDEDKVTPVYKLEEICELLRSSHVSIVKEVSEFILKRLEHKSPIVKQKALRLIKYAVGKTGSEFRREMQRHSVTVRQLSHYKGQLDPLKGDSLNKAVRDTANEAIAAIFAAEDSKPAPAENLNKRIQGFGNTNYEVPSDDKKSFLSEVVGLGSASIKQGLSTFTQGHSMRKNDNGSYKSPNLRRSLTSETDSSDTYEPVELQTETQGRVGISKNVAGGSWNNDSRIMTTEIANGDSSSSSAESKTHEETLMDKIVTSGGVRLQPTRDAIQSFLVEASKLDALALTQALEAKLRSPLWQVRMKAVCVLEAILRKKDDEPFLVIAAYFFENKEVVVQCSGSPQSSLREKANKVLSLLGERREGGLVNNLEKSAKSDAAVAVQIPDLIDTGDPDEFLVIDDSSKIPIGPRIGNPATPSPLLIDDLFGNTMSSSVNTGEQKNDDDPFADVSFHTNEGKEHDNDLFLGMAIDDKPSINQTHMVGTLGNKGGSELFDIFESKYELGQEQVNYKTDVNDIMGGLSISEKGNFAGGLSESVLTDSSSSSGPQVSSDLLSRMVGSQGGGMNANPVFPLNNMQYSIPPGIMLNPSFHSQTINYGAMGNLFAQQQLLAAMSNLQHLGNLNAENAGVGNLNTAKGEYASPIPDIFQSNFPNQTPSSTTSSSKKEETRAFDFISDHLASARNPKSGLRF
ncbi:VHS domain-containing protein [Tripterygium wilfordii]|uniref:VHS domain-containing protein n=1 Tax=Tripterygium wilfordii TaxID=458696 RepID=A0A7J7D5R8_TRIWF|nr:protein MODIFIED TRANSPORT TO THE VACUOLE 1-like [Tripterygium wilfordii]KAF5741664.1 VHS domain-containing protein [Tripterygium wilfordii]